jgi:hypothetical protein
LGGGYGGGDVGDLGGGYGGGGIPAPAPAPAPAPETLPPQGPDCNYLTLSPGDTAWSLDGGKYGDAYGAIYCGVTCLDGGTLERTGAGDTVACAPPPSAPCNNLNVPLGGRARSLGGGKYADENGATYCSIVCADGGYLEAAEGTGPDVLVTCVAHNPGPDVANPIEGY